jgi:hypothetical protein
VYGYGFNLLSNQDGQKSERACTRYLSYLIILYYANNSSLIFPLLKRIRHSAGRMTYRMPGDFPFITPAPPAGLEIPRRYLVATPVCAPNICSPMGRAATPVSCFRSSAFKVFELKTANRLSWPYKPCLASSCFQPILRRTLRGRPIGAVAILSASSPSRCACAVWEGTTPWR